MSKTNDKILKDILKPNNIDINDLFSLSYTFENLKSFADKIITNQQAIVKKFEEIEKQLSAQKEDNKKHESIQSKIDNRLKNLEIGNSKFRKEVLSMMKNKDQTIPTKKHRQQSPKDTEKEKDQREDSKEKDHKEDSNIQIEIKSSKKLVPVEKQVKKISNFDKVSSSPKKENKDDSVDEDDKKADIYYEDSSMSSDDLLEIKQKLTDFEDKFEQLEQKIAQIPANTKKTPLLNAENFIMDDKNEEISMLKLQMKELVTKTENFKTENDVFKKKLEEISVKVMEFNIYDVLGKCEVTGGSVDASKILIMNLEQKVFAKISIMDDKIKKNEEDIYKLHNDFQNVKNQADVITNNIDNFKGKIKELVAEVQNTNDNNSNLVNEMGNKVNENYKKILTRIEEERNINKKNLDKIKKQIKQLLNKDTEEDDKINNNENGLSASDLKILSDLTKRTNEVEKEVKMMKNTLDLTTIKDDIFKIESELAQKTSLKDFFELNDKIKIQETIINNQRELIERVQEVSNKNMKENSFFVKKIESLTASVIQMRETLEALCGMKNDNEDDSLKYIMQETFNEFLKADTKEKTNLNRYVDDLRRKIKELSEIVSKKVEEDDMKNFEVIINNKFEELRLMCGKKFADKSDTSKSLKYLDQQLKYLTDILMKKGDTRENWLLAKKPVGGYTCAACESYIGDLREKDNFIPWNKYPQRDKNYRVGNGFSRMLNMLNLDIKSNVVGIKENNNNFNYESDEEYEKSKTGRLYTTSTDNYVNKRNKNFFNNSNVTSNLNKSNALPTIANKNKTIDEGVNHDEGGNENISYIHENEKVKNNEDYINYSKNISANKDNGGAQPKIVKVVRKK